MPPFAKEVLAEHGQPLTPYQTGISRAHHSLRQAVVLVVDFEEAIYIALFHWRAQIISDI
jgi:hypothetical protein